MLLLVFSLGLGACSTTRSSSYGLPERPPPGNSEELESPRGHISFQPAFAPISFEFDGQSLKVQLDSKVVTPIGVVKMGGSTGEVVKPDGKPLTPEPSDVTQLIVCRQDSNGQTCDATRINTGRKITVEMNGRFIQEVERNRIVIHADPGATVKLTDSGPPSKKDDVRGPAREDIEEFDFHATSPDTDVDLERSQAGLRADLRYDHVTGELSMINGAKLAPYDTYEWSEPGKATDYPGEAECLAVEQDKWVDRLNEDQLESEHIIVCVKTSEADLGYLLLAPDRKRKPVAYYVYSYVWVR
ncbi:hypothetical protein [Lentzea sp. CA-135723]|uniref:hypothetical protein n=1 Tax=Lentzea sp. CA-135723 TaxID=3239950 RepID=UPI003D89E3A2